MKPIKNLIPSVLVQKPAARLPIALAVTAAMALLPVLAAAAPKSSFAESRGYQACRDAAAREAILIGVEKRYFIYEQEDARRYYMNGYARQGGASTPVKIDCQTTISGRRVEAVSVDTGHFAGRLVERPVVAGN
jgi:hypothetical protein